MDSESYYQINNFGFTYPGSKRAINWLGKHSIDKGERILLTGYSGSGKSTLLYGLMGFFPDTIYGFIQGDILFSGESVFKNPGILSGKVGLVLQNPSAQMLCKTVEEELAFGLENLAFPVSRIKKTIIKNAAKFNLTHLLQRNTSTLSGGEKQKIALLSILLTKPDILMLDEPTAFLDPSSSKEIMDIIRNTDYENTLIFVEHNLHFLQNLITRNLHLENSGNVLDKRIEDINWQPDIPRLSSQPKGKKLLSLDNICFSYNGNQLLKEIELELYTGEIIGIKGKNGSGKSTLLQIIAGLKKPDKGNIVSTSRNIHNNPRKLRVLSSLLFQDPENHFIYNRIDQELKGNNIEYLTNEFKERSEQSPFTLSEGEKRRLSTAIACSNDKMLLLLDEPTFGQDIPSKLNLISLLGLLRDNGLSILIVSHDEPFLKAVTSKTYELRDGKLQ